MGRKLTYNEEQLNILRKNYPSGDWDIIQATFPNKSRANIRALARKHGITRERDLKKDLDISGQTFGNLTALYKIDNERPVKWKCKCSCGNETIVDVYSLINHTIKSCGCLKHRPAINANDLTGQRFGMLTAIERLSHYRGKDTYYRCICDCGREKIVSQSNLRLGHTKSCGPQNHSRKEYELFNHDLDDKEETFYVYRHVSPSGKSYIGITKQEPERRFQNGEGYKTQAVFYRAIQKYGWDSFKHEILEEGLTEKEACEKEAYYISEVYKSFAPNGYNTQEGGFHGRTFVYPVIQYFEDKPVNFFEGIMQAAKEMGIAAKTIRIHTGKENAIEGYYFEILPPIMPYNIDAELTALENKEHYRIKDIIDKDHKNKTIQRNYETRKPVNQYTLDGKYVRSFPSLVEARKSITVGDGGAIDAAVNPKRQGEAAYGYMWKYDTGDHSDIEPIKYKHQKAVLKIDKNSGKIIERYKSMAEASRSLKVSMHKIKYACDGKDSFDTFILKFE